MLVFLCLIGTLDFISWYTANVWFWVALGSGIGFIVGFIVGGVVIRNLTMTKENRDEENGEDEGDTTLTIKGDDIVNLRIVAVSRDDDSGLSTTSLNTGQESPGTSTELGIDLKLCICKTVFSFGFKLVFTKFPLPNYFH